MKKTFNFLEKETSDLYKPEQLEYWNEVIEAFNLVQEKYFYNVWVENFIIKIIKFEQLVGIKNDVGKIHNNFKRLLNLFIVDYTQKSFNTLDKFLDDFQQFKDIYNKYKIENYKIITNFHTAEDWAHACNLIINELNDFEFKCVTEVNYNNYKSLHEKLHNLLKIGNYNRYFNKLLNPIKELNWDIELSFNNE